MRQCNRSLAVFAALGLAVSALAEPLTTAEQVIAFSTLKMAAYTSWSADILATNTSSGPVSSGHIVFRAPNQIRITWDTLVPQVSMIDAHGVLWRETKYFNLAKVSRRTVGQAPGTLCSVDTTISQQWPMWEKLCHWKLAGTSAVPGQSFYILDGVRKEPANSRHTEGDPALGSSALRVYIGQQDGFAYKCEIVGQPIPGYMAKEFTNVKFDVKLPDALFSYTPPSGFTVVDLDKAPDNSPQPPLRVK